MCGRLHFSVQSRLVEFSSLEPLAPFVTSYGQFADDVKKTGKSGIYI